jgi:hypothetical protein
MIGIKRKKTLISVTSVLTITSFILVIGATRQGELLISGAPVKIKSEHYSFTTWFVEVQMPKQYYSKDNLERIWQYYCEKYPDKKDKLDVRVCTDFTHLRSGSLEKHSYDAMFSRQGEGAIAGGGENEFYTYRPNLDKPDEKKNIQLKGTYPFLRDTYTGYPNSDFVVAARKGDITRLEALFKEGIDIDVRDDKGRTALMAACNSGQTEIVKILLAKGADVNAKDNTGETALNDAVMAVVSDPNEKNGWRWGHPEIVRMLLGNGADVNAQKEGWTPLLCAASHGNNDIVRMLLNAGADVDSKTYTGMTALARSLYDGRPQISKMLLKSGADVEARDNEGYTPLMRAATGYVEVVRLLLEKGVDVQATNIHGETALKIAKSYPDNHQIIQMLLKAGARE